MREVKFKKFNPVEKGDHRYPGFVNHEFIHEGFFHQWGSDFEEFESGPASYTIAIVETYDGKIQKVLPEHIKFINKQT